MRRKTEQNYILALTKSDCFSSNMRSMIVNNKKTIFFFLTFSSFRFEATLQSSQVNFVVNSVIIAHRYVIISLKHIKLTLLMLFFFKDKSDL